MIAATTEDFTGPTPRKPRGTKQDWGTPPEFIAAVQARFGNIDIDLAARDDNAKAPRWITPEINSLAVDWSQFAGVGYLNPPFEDIEPWARKCAESASPRFRIVCLWLASVDSLWFDRWVLPYAVSCGVSRMQFVGADWGYPKSLMVSVFGLGASGFGPLWRWKQ